MTEPEKLASPRSQAAQETQVGLPLRCDFSPPRKLRLEGQQRVRSG